MYAVDDKFTAYDLVFFLQQECKYLILRKGKVQDLPLPGDLHFHLVNPECFLFEARRESVITLDRRLDPGNEFSVFIRFGDIIIRADIKCHDLVADIGTGG